MRAIRFALAARQEARETGRFAATLRVPAAFGDGIMKITCKECGVELTGELVKLTDKGKLNEDDGAEFLPRGFFMHNYADYFTQFPNALIINLVDATNLKAHPDSTRWNGCCGADGCDGMNQTCSNGHPVATEKSDCWMPHCLIFDRERVSLSE